jgi:hypothetical protein
MGRRTGKGEKTLMTVGGPFTLTPIQCEIIKSHNIDQLVDIVYERYEEEGRRPPYKVKIKKAIKNVRKIVDDKNLTRVHFLTELEKRILKECVHSSDFLDKQEERYRKGIIKGRQLGADIRTFNNLIDKYRQVGLF